MASKGSSCSTVHCSRRALAFRRRSRSTVSRGTSREGSAHSRRRRPIPHPSHLRRNRSRQQWVRARFPTQHKEFVSNGFPLQSLCTRLVQHTCSTPRKMDSTTSAARLTLLHSHSFCLATRPRNSTTAAMPSAMQYATKSSHPPPNHRLKKSRLYSTPSTSHAHRTLPCN